MYCEKCGARLEAEGGCSECRLDGDHQVKVLTVDEKQSFQGVTIEAPENKEHHQYSRPGGGRKVQYKVVTFGSEGAGLLTKLVIAAVVLFLLVVALPVLFFGGAAALVAWFIFRQLSR